MNRTTSRYLTLSLICFLLAGVTYSRPRRSHHQNGGDSSHSQSNSPSLSVLPPGQRPVPTANEGETASPDHLETIEALQEAGVRSGEALGYMGVSPEALEYLEAHGRFPENMQSNPLGVEFQAFSDGANDDSSEFAIVMASLDAESMSERHAVMTTLGFAIDDVNANYAAQLIMRAQKYPGPDGINMDTPMRYLSRYGINEQEVRAAAIQAQGRRGFVVAIGADAVEHHRLVRNGTDTGFLVTDSHGFSIDRLIGIGPAEIELD